MLINTRLGGEGANNRSSSRHFVRGASIVSLFSFVYVSFVCECVCKYKIIRQLHITMGYNMYDLLCVPGGLIIVHCRITRDTVNTHISVDPTYCVSNPIRGQYTIVMRLSSRLVYNKQEFDMQPFPFTIFHFFFFSFFFLPIYVFYVVCLRIPGVRVKYKCLRMFFSFFFIPFFQIISRTGGCLGSRDRDQLQPALTTLTN